jgi:hypothetical protein
LTVFCRLTIITIKVTFMFAGSLHNDR